MDEKNGIELPMNGASDEAAEGNSPTPESNSEAAEAVEPGEQAPDQSPPADEVEVTPDAVGDEANSSDLLSTDDVDSAMRNAAAEELTLNEQAGDIKEPEVNRADFQQLSVDSKTHEAQNIKLLMDVELPVSIELGRTRMHISEILTLGPGSVVELDKLVGEPVDLLVNRKKVARGEVVVVEENFGLRITQLISPEERLKNLQ